MDNGQLLANETRVAATFMTRLKGLLFTISLPFGHGLHLQPCRSVHTFFMTYPIDAVYLDDRNRIIGIDENLRPGKLGSRVPGTVSVLELPAGMARKTGTKTGHSIQFKSNHKKGDVLHVEQIKRID